MPCDVKENIFVWERKDSGKNLQSFNFKVRLITSYLVQTFTKVDEMRLKLWEDNLKMCLQYHHNSNPHTQPNIIILFFYKEWMMKIQLGRWIEMDGSWYRKIFLIWRKREVFYLQISTLVTLLPLLLQHNILLSQYFLLLHS